MQSHQLVDLLFKARYKRGAILRFEMLCDDPNRVKRNKFGIVLNFDLSDAEVLLAITTTNAKYLDSRFLERDGVCLAPSKYDCLPEATYISLREIKTYSLDSMKEKCFQEKLRFVGQLQPDDLTEIDQKLKNSLLIEGVILKRILC